jgi:hypothetical protein
MRLLYGLDRLPRSLPFDDPRLPGVELGPAPLRLNTEPVPAAVLASAVEGHAGRVAAMVAWLQSQCGDYAVTPRRAVADYITGCEAMIEAHRTALEAGLLRYAGLYAAEDWLWSALRPLPRAWVMTETGPVKYQVAFWDGERLLAETPAAPFWHAEILPRSPFRRAAVALA